MAEVLISYSLYGIIAIAVGIPAALMAAAKRSTPKPSAPPPMVAPVAPMVTPPAAIQASAPATVARVTRHHARLSLGYAAPASRECGICHTPLSPVVLRTHDGLWRCAKHKNVTVG